MSHKWKGLAGAGLTILLAFGPARAGGPLPNPVVSCDDVRAYVGADNAMPMEAFKQLMIAAGNDLSGRGGAALDTQCKLTAFVKHIVMVQPILRSGGGSQISISTEIVNDGGVCRLTKIELNGC